MDKTGALVVPPIFPLFCCWTSHLAACSNFDLSQRSAKPGASQGRKAKGALKRSHVPQAQDAGLHPYGNAVPI